MSPLLYNIYTADIPASDVYTETPTYADDTAIICYSGNRNISVRYLQRASNALEEQMEKLKISINPEKRKAVLFSWKKTPPSIKLKVENLELDWRKTAKYLGVIIDLKLTWRPHVRQTLAKVQPGAPNSIHSSTEKAD